MPIPSQELKVLAAILRYAREHIDDAQRMISEVEVRDAGETAMLRNLRDISARIQHEQGSLSAMLIQAAKRAEPGQ